MGFINLKSLSYVIFQLISHLVKPCLLMIPLKNVFISIHLMQIGFLPFGFAFCYAGFGLWMEWIYTLILFHFGWGGFSVDRFAVSKCYVVFTPTLWREYGCCCGISKHCAFHEFEMNCVIDVGCAFLKVLCYISIFIYRWLWLICLICCKYNIGVYGEKTQRNTSILSYLFIEKLY